MHRSVRLVIFALALPLALATQAGAAHAAPALDVPAQSRELSPCIAEPSKYAAPDILLLGEQTQVTLHVKAYCAGEIYPLHIVLVLDKSGSMCGSKMEDMKDAAIKLIKGLHLRDNPSTQIGAVAFNSSAEKLTDLTNQETRAISAIRRIQCGGGTAIDQGMAEGLKVMLKGRRSLPDDTAVNEVMVVLSDGGNNAGCPPVLQEAGKIKGNGILLATICVGNDCDAACMRQAASSPRYFFQLQDVSGLVAVFERIRKDVENIVLKKLTVKDTIPDNMRYVPGSANPEPKNISSNGDLLEWETNFVPSEGMTYTFLVEPLETGFWPTNVEASLLFRDNKNREGTKVFPIPFVRVLQPDPLPTRTIPPPPPTFTVTPTPTLTPTPAPPTDTPTPTPTPTPGPIYLPILIWHPCEAWNWYSDVALVLDMSTSMRRISLDGSRKTKLAATLEAAKFFVDHMQNLEPDNHGQFEQVAIVGFNRSAWIEQELTSDRNLAKAAIDRLGTKLREYTRLDLAIKVGGEATGGPAHRETNRKVVILLTDGLPNQVPYAEDGTMETTILREALVTKSTGNLVYTIAIGRPADTNPALLRDVATDASMYYYMPEADDLEQVYSEIYGTLSCPQSRYTWPDMPWPESP